MGVNGLNKVTNARYSNLTKYRLTPRLRNNVVNCCILRTKGSFTDDIF